MKVELFSILRVGIEPRFNIFGVVSVKLSLNEAARFF
jgi:hypothetical protein